MSNMLIIYHKNCYDGLGAAYAAYLKFGNNATYYPMSYKDPLPMKLEKNIYLLDFSLPRNQMEQLSKMHNLVVIDHHKTAKSNLEGLDYCIFDMNKSGARMAWEYFHPDKPVPKLIEYIEDRDIWKWELPSSEEINSNIFSYPLDFSTFSVLCSMLEQDAYLESFIKEGEAISRSKLRYIENVAQFAKVTELPADFGPYSGDKCVVVNAPYTNISDLLHYLCEKYKLPTIGFFKRQDNIWQYSFRSTNDMADVSMWAKHIGGGGHRNASGAESGSLLF